MRTQKGLVFDWAKARLSRGPFNPLPPNECQQNPHPVAEVEEHPDTNAPILYAQHRNSRDATIYKEVEPPREALTASVLKTIFIDHTGQKRPLEVQVSYEFPSSAIVSLQVTASPPDVTVGLGSWDQVAASPVYDEKQFTSAAKAKNLEAGNRDVGDKLMHEDLTWLPTGIQKDKVLFLSGEEFNDGPINLEITTDASGHFETAASTMYVVDPKGHLIATGAYYQVIPK